MRLALHRLWYVQKGWIAPLKDTRHGAKCQQKGRMRIHWQYSLNTTVVILFVVTDTNFIDEINLLSGTWTFFASRRTNVYQPGVKFTGVTDPSGKTFTKLLPIDATAAERSVALLLSLILRIATRLKRILGLQVNWILSFPHLSSLQKNETESGVIVGVPANVIVGFGVCVFVGSLVASGVDTVREITGAITVGGGVSRTVVYTIRGVDVGVASASGSELVHPDKITIATSRIKQKNIIFFCMINPNLFLND